MVKTYQVVATVVYKTGFEKVYKGEKVSVEDADRTNIDAGIAFISQAVKQMYREDTSGSINVGDHVIRVGETVSVSFVVVEGY